MAVLSGNRALRGRQDGPGEGDTDSWAVPASALRRIRARSHEAALAAEDLAESMVRIADSTTTAGDAVRVATIATERVSQDASAVATAAQQMASAMSEVSRSAAQAASVTVDASQVTEEVRGSIARLVSSTGQIDDVVKAVSGISDQTRLLALNATIEAARAGTAGKGFAVVAEEVKNLAAETSSATTEIATKLSELAEDSECVRRSAERIDEVLSRIEQLQETIAAAVDQQTGAIQEINRSAAEAADAAEDLKSSVAASAEAAEAAETGVTRARAWIGRLADAVSAQGREIDSVAADLEMHPLQAAVLAHAAWKKRVRQGIETGRLEAGLDLSTLSRDDACAFGAWLRSGEAEALDAGRTVRVAALHSRFHACVAQVLTAATQGRREEAEHLMTSDGGYCEVATALTDALIEWADRGG